MKYVIILGDGWADYPDENGQTPLSIAKKPNIDRIAALSECGLCQTVPEGLSPGSDVANLSVLGFDPKKYYTGRSPLEAASIGIKLNGSDVTYRMNFVTLSGEKEYAQKTMLDYSAGEISTEDARGLVELLKPHVPEGFELFAGISYRHCLVEHNAAHKAGAASFTPPHDITGKTVGAYLPKGEGAELLSRFQKTATDLLSNCPENRTKANSVWIWGMGTKPKLPDFKTEFGVKGAMISAVDLLKGIGILSGLTVLNISGATGNLHTNFDGKAAAAIDALKTHDYVYLHIEAPDECGHQGDKPGKIRAVELIDQKVVRPVFTALDGKETFKMLILPDHATPLCLKTHTSDPVPYILYDSRNQKSGGIESYTEAAARATGICVKDGPALIRKMLQA